MMVATVEAKTKVVITAPTIVWLKELHQEKR